MSPKDILILLRVRTDLPIRELRKATFWRNQTGLKVVRARAHLAVQDADTGRALVKPRPRSRRVA